MTLPRLVRLATARGPLLQFARRVSDHSGLLLETDESVFSRRPTSDLLRTLAVLQVCAFDRVVDNSLQLMRLGERLLGRWLLQLLLQPFYRQFVAGEERHELDRVVSSLRADNVRFMLTSMLEADVDEEAVSEEHLIANLEEAIRQLEMVRELTPPDEQPVIQSKFTAHIDINIMVHASKVFSESSNPAVLVEQLANAMVTSGQVNIPGLTSEQQKGWDSCVHRLKTLGDACARHNVIMFVDAEFTYTNPAIFWLTMALMAALNQRQALIRSTQQCYLKATPDEMRRQYAICSQLGACFGAKLVRGAYMTRERQLAAEEGRPSPVCDTYEDTTANFTQAVDFGLRRVAADGGRTQVTVASHNHQSIIHALRLADEFRLPADGGVSFGQVYGMADYLTVPLARAGWRVYKAVPFGDFATVMPYLSRRAAESRLLLRGVRVERQLLISELASRFRLRRPAAADWRSAQTGA